MVVLQFGLIFTTGLKKKKHNIVKPINKNYDLDFIKEFIQGLITVTAIFNTNYHTLPKRHIAALRNLF